MPFLRVARWLAYIPRQGHQIGMRGDRSSVKAITWQDHACARMMIVSRFANVAPSRSLRGFSEEDVGTLGRGIAMARQNAYGLGLQRQSIRSSFVQHSCFC